MNSGRRSELLLTGATGFIGGAVMARLLADGKYGVRVSLRQAGQSLPSAVEEVQVSDLAAGTDWREAVAGVEVVVHAAARVHVMREGFADALAAYRRVNVEGTLNLARQAVAAGVRRFVFISSVKVHGEQSGEGGSFTEEDTPRPEEPYAVSKYEAEQGLKALADETGMVVVIIRPVLVYGPGVKGNFRSMMRWLYRGVPLPLGAIHNRRSLVALDNLVDFIVTCVDHPAAANQVFLVSDGEDLSTTDLLRRMAAALGVVARLVPVPEWLLRFGATMVGQRALARRLLGSLQVDIAKAQDLLGWTPPVGVEAALRSTARHFLESLHSS
ncbi:UDP-glucose 4-epimerase [Desulfolithobacter dissulfuricans]|uniref:UDP-glucose 4-epimerase n=1 Tax=Desulfolithobacter dissulfuricans TaxID=2795293 RepID=A0A915XIE5_9BACT|nr:NAD-dependent epimerase/dehydratase family protein [Desulfolithobacter dissulfuricans]BCO09739.1 UDP-glucose 4-epimerase [Desulfolithobacter dissulfuricans]